MNRKKDTDRLSRAQMGKPAAQQKSLTGRVAKVQQKAAALGFLSTESDIDDDKAFMDYMWED